MLRTIVKAALCATASLGIATAAHAGAVITAGNISLGVNDHGQLNFGGIGVQDNRTGFDGTIAGCLCEGWGVANDADNTAGWANQDEGGATNLSLVSFINTAATATSVVDVTGGTSSMQVTHNFLASLSPDLYQVDVTITNTGTDPITDLLYRRLMDWDVEPTPFSEFVTIQGWPATALLHTSDDGFESANPLSSFDGIIAPDNSNFVDSGPFDHGALFDFAFGSLDPGDSFNFTIFYGASLSEADALAALATVGAEVYSLGQSNDNMDGSTERRSTFIFAFEGVGGTPVGGIPEPSTWAMMLMGFGVTGFAIRRRRRNESVPAIA